ncbi:3-hydroxyacyl-[acyl-carrier-protein] dehydratase [Fervidobacterium changbaicum]|uniref:3-hydroxyacyl-[acyl-carrier-protein] dehydratase n=2 Tax=Fervidobacterium TaxID=2422 RepID=A0AAI8CKG9_FERIS|nr:MULTISPECIES: 3-hydroxyacyl-ACP dehydratase FabZ [Fervidobacterium]AMW32586.1 3-hydroxyacyl-ACP dehydratase FabZ [Fervidobacterium islandicum]QAV32563.1 3-hydroxyacyl-ACP dehydratase FabZ [Fervidobacterium changbaicum]SDH66839.1 3-hydroxyacyl-[acyl-carrier-protein] dehydratase [Fervidobacterium changbaicum]
MSERLEENRKTLKTKDEILKILPHRDPILLVDEVLEQGEDYIVAKKYVKSDEPIFKGHFPDYPIYPGVYIIEGLAQAAGVLLLEGLEKDSIPIFIGIDEARFKKEVRPDCELLYEVKVVDKKGPIVIVDGKAKVGDQLVAKARLMVGVKRSEADGK